MLPKYIQKKKKHSYAKQEYAICANGLILQKANFVDAKSQNKACALYQHNI